MRNFFSKLNESLNHLLFLLGLRGGVHWGTVYDSRSKQPIDPAIVKLIHVDSAQVLASNITDLRGHYGFLAWPGRYKILVKKSNYIFPSHAAAGGKDGIYKNLYHGEFFEIRGGSEVVSFNIPMDPLAQDWNQQSKEERVNYFPYLEQFLRKLEILVFWFVLLLSGLAFGYYHYQPAKIVLIIYAAIILLNFILPKPRLWGRVINKKTGQPAVDAEISVSIAQLPNIIIAKTTSFEDGKFFLHLNPGKYLLRITRPEEGVSRQLQIKPGWLSVVNKTYRV